LRDFDKILREAPQRRAQLEPKLRHWQTDPDFAGVREEEALARLPEPEGPVIFLVSE
jgi:hypothetical protein